MSRCVITVLVACVFLGFAYLLAAPSFESVVRPRLQDPKQCPDSDYIVFRDADAWDLFWSTRSVVGLPPVDFMFSKETLGEWLASILGVSIAAHGTKVWAAVQGP